MHADEVDTDPSLVQRLVSGQFPEWADLPIEPVFPLGTDNANYRLGHDKLVRLPRRPGKFAGLERELEWLPVLAPALPLAIPAPLGRGEPAEGFPSPWAVFTWLDGHNVAVDDAAPETGDDLVELILALRELGATDAPPGLRRGTLLELDDWVRSCAAQLDPCYDAAGLLAAWEETLEAPPWDGPPTWCHCDLDLRNVVFRNGRPSGVLDWGGAGEGDPASDSAVAWKILPSEARPAFSGTRSAPTRRR
jgi:aminoglycoside phosphotransferase (APT) family kinase protein